MLPELLAIGLVLVVAGVAVSVGESRFYLESAVADLLLGLTPAISGAIVGSPAVSDPEISAAAAGLFIAGESLFGLSVVLLLSPFPLKWIPRPDISVAGAVAGLLLSLLSFTALPARVGPRDPAVYGIFLTVLAIYYFSVARRPGTISSLKGFSLLEAPEQKVPV